MAGWALGAENNRSSSRLCIQPPTGAGDVRPSLGLISDCITRVGDIRDLLAHRAKKAVDEVRPPIFVFHLAAQSLVPSGHTNSRSRRMPPMFLGDRCNVLEAVRLAKRAGPHRRGRSPRNKCYGEPRVGSQLSRRGIPWADTMPYSSSKGPAELTDQALIPAGLIVPRPTPRSAGPSRSARAGNG